MNSSLIGGNKRCGDVEPFCVRGGFLLQLTEVAWWEQTGWHSAWSVHREHHHPLELSVEANSQRLPADPLDWSIREEGTATGSVGYSRNY